MKGLTYRTLHRLNQIKRLKNTINNALLLTLMLFVSIGVFSINANVIPRGNNGAVAKNLVNMTCVSSEFSLGDVVETENTVYRCSVITIAGYL